MDVDNRVKQLEDELKVLKNEIQAVLLDVREDLLSHENPFSAAPAAGGNQPIIIQNQSSSPNGHGQEQSHQAEKRETASPAANEAQAGPKAVESPKPSSRPAPLDEEAPPPRQQATVVEQEDTGRHPFARPEPPASAHPSGNSGPRSAKLPAWERHTTSAEPRGGHEAPTEGSDRTLELTTLVGLAQWVESTVSRLGPAKTLAILDVSEVMGHMSTQLKTVLAKLVHNGHGEPGKPVTPGDYLKCLIELGNLLGKDGRPDSLFYPLYVLCSVPGGNGHG